jgi:hypothetical protein
MLVLQLKDGVFGSPEHSRFLDSEKDANAYMLALSLPVCKA